MNWAQKQRQDFITRTFATVGHINRSALIDVYGISPAQAAKDLGQWLKSNPDRVTYNATSKRYEAQTPVKSDADLFAENAKNVPEVYVLVPVEPTEAMLQEAFQCIDWARSHQKQRHLDDNEVRETLKPDVGTTPRQDLISAYRAMIAAGRTA